MFDNSWNKKLTEILDRLTSDNPTRLKRIRSVSIVIGITTVFFLIVVWGYQIYLATLGIAPTKQWFIWYQFLPMLVFGLPCYYGYYFSDLGLFRNHYDNRHGWWH